LLLFFAAGASALSGEWIDSGVVLAILVASIGIGTSREYRAQSAAERLKARVRVQANVLRDGRAASLPAREVVPGDVVLLSAGSLVPADAVLLGAADFLVNEAVLTGESFPVEKRPRRVLPSAALRERTNCVFLGTNVRSGTARCLVVASGAATQFGAIAHRLTLRPPETEFDRGLRRFGLFLPFLPLLAGQILANNFLSDVPAIGLADDSVNSELVARPRRWDMRFIGRFMVEFGILSSLFDFLTFGVLLGLFAATAELFRSGWFVESLLTELVIALVVRTRRPFFRSRPGRLLLGSTLAVVLLTLALPYLPVAHVLGFVPLPAALLASLAGITVLYVAAAELAKRSFYRRAA